jgi:hypothetical protein
MDLQKYGGRANAMMPKSPPTLMLLYNNVAKLRHFGGGPAVEK